MITILYTDTTEVRGAMLLPEEALPDSVFSAALYARELKLDLDEWCADHATIYAESNTTKNALLRNYATYWCGRKVAAVLSASLPSQVGDGKNMEQRTIDYLTLQVEMTARMAAAKEALLRAKGNAASTVPKQATIVGLAVDPVTNG